MRECGRVQDERRGRNAFLLFSSAHSFSPVMYVRRFPSGLGVIASFPFLPFENKRRVQSNPLQPSRVPISDQIGPLPLHKFGAKSGHSAAPK